MKISKIVSILLILEVVYSLYKTLPNFFLTFDPSRAMLYVIAFSPIILLLIGAIGIFFNKKWAIIVLWVSVLLPLAIKMVLPLIKITGGYYLLIINILIAIYLTISLWNKKSEQ